MPVRPRPRPRALAAGLALVLALAGCSGDGGSINEQMKKGDQKGYVAGDGTIEALAPQDRTTEVTLSGTTLEGRPWALADQSGSVVVINVWGSWCGPCVAEAPDLVQVAQGYTKAGSPVRFVGVNTRDAVDSALAFEKKYRVPYPSLRDDGGRTLAQLGRLAVARPTTLVVDPQGRLAARVNGQVAPATLRGLVDDVLAEGGDGAGATGGDGPAATTGAGG